jgi:molecular chaperone GrpE
MSDATERTLKQTPGARGAPGGGPARERSDPAAAGSGRLPDETAEEKAANSQGAGASQAAPEAAPGGSAGGRRGGNGGQAVAGDGDVAEIEGDLDELVKTAAQRDEYLALAQRTQADFENYRKRVARESAAAQERGAAGLARELLPALDNLDRALDEASRTDEPLLAGVRLVHSELSAALARFGIESFSPKGEMFDPALHEAMASLPQPPGGAASGTVVEVYQPGYRLGESIIRPARVVVAA